MIFKKSIFFYLLYGAISTTRKNTTVSLSHDPLIICIKEIKNITELNSEVWPIFQWHTHEVHCYSLKKVRYGRTKKLLSHLYQTLY